MEFSYRVYELSVASTRQLPYLIHTENNVPDILVTFTENHPERPPSEGFFYFWQPLQGGLSFWTYLSEGYAEYIISANGSAITIAHSEQAPFLEVMRYLTGASLGAALRFRGVLCLHASAVAVNGSALVFAGPSHAGKSSLSAAFHRRGYPLISEDVVAVDKRDTGVFVRPGYAGIRLYPDTLDYLYGPTATTEAMQVDRKYLHRLDAILTVPCPIRAFYLLLPRNPGLSEPRVTSINATSALLALTDHLYLHHFGPKEWLARDFPRLGELVRQVPVYLLERPDSLSSLDSTVDLLLERHEATVSASIDSGQPTKE